MLHVQAHICANIHFNACVLFCFFSLDHIDLFEVKFQWLTNISKDYVLFSIIISIITQLWLWCLPCSPEIPWFPHIKYTNDIQLTRIECSNNRPKPLDGHKPTHHSFYWWIDWCYGLDTLQQLVNQTESNTFAVASIVDFSHQEKEQEKYSTTFQINRSFFFRFFILLPFFHFSMA